MTFQTQFRYVPPHASPRHWRDSNSLLSDNSCVEPPDPIPNSEVKRTCADGSVALPCESRSSLSIYTEGRSPKGTGLLLFEVRDAGVVAEDNPATPASVCGPQVPRQYVRTSTSRCASLDGSRGVTAVTPWNTRLSSTSAMSRGRVRVKLPSSAPSGAWIEVVPRSMFRRSTSTTST